MNRFLLFIEKCKQYSLLQIFTVYLRYLLGAGFVIAAFGMGKFSGQQLAISNAGTPIEALQPLQQFFRVISTSGLYWQFIGLTQIIGGGLLMTQRFAKLGAVIFFALILNIFVITISYSFNGTPVVTGLMLLATLYLIFWDLHSFQFLFRDPMRENLLVNNKLIIAEHPFWLILGVIMLVTIISLVFFKVNVIVQMLIVFGEGVLAFILYFSIFRNTRISSVKFGSLF